jgi:hypothetical protein
VQQWLQVREEANTLAVHCAAGLKVSSLGNEATNAARQFAIANAGHLVVCSPHRLNAALQDGSLPAAHLLEHLKVRPHGMAFKR